MGTELGFPTLEKIYGENPLETGRKMSQNSETVPDVLRLLRKIVRTRSRAQMILCPVRAGKKEMQ